ncbi:MAG TPA: hypothetical protein VK524_16280 [Polyangiaceae bacterium]|nr:hypothetical protein [Polyangiaceae bacterium]
MPIARKWLLVAAVFVVACVFGLIWIRNHIVIGVELDDELRVVVRGRVPFRTTIEQPVDVTIDEEIRTKVKLGAVAIDLNEQVDVPLRMNIRVPIDSDVRIEQPLELALDVPIDTVLTEKELDLNQLTIPIDQRVFIDDAIDLDVVVPIDTTVTTTLGVRVPVKANLPVKMRVPIKQALHVRDSLRLKLKDVRVPLKMVVPVRAKVALNETFRVRGTIDAPIEQSIRVPLRKTIRPTLGAELPVTVGLSGKFPALIKAKLDSSVSIDAPVQTRLGPLRIAGQDVTVHVAR